MKKKKKNHNMSFQGYGRLPINADTMTEFMANSEFFGDWRDKRERIMGKPRWYKICLYLTDANGEPFHTANVPNQRTDQDSLWQLLAYLVGEVMKEYPDRVLNKHTSYATISVPKPTHRTK